MKKHTPYTFKNNWLFFEANWSQPRFQIAPASYFDDRAEISITPTLVIGIIGLFITGFSFLSLIWIPFFIYGWGSLYIHLPIHSGINECETPSYGFYLFHPEFQRQFFTSLWLQWGMKNKCFYMPWDWDWVRTSCLRADGTWEHSVKGDNKSFWEDKWNGILFTEKHPYAYNLKSGEVQDRIATIRVEEREWRWRALKWLSYPSKTNKTLEITFSDEVGERSGSWKGGCISCSYTMLPDETPYDCLKRMEKHRIFK